MCTIISFIYLTRARESKPGVFGSLEPDPTEKKTGAGAAPKKTGAGAAKNIPAPRR